MPQIGIIAVVIVVAPRLLIRYFIVIKNVLDSIPAFWRGVLVSVLVGIIAVVIIVAFRLLITYSPDLKMKSQSDYELLIRKLEHYGNSLEKNHKPVFHRNHLSWHESD